MKIQSILCPTDFSEFSAGALEHAVLLASRYGAELSIAHVYPLMAVMSGDAVYFPSGLPLDDGTRARLRVALESAAEPARAAGVKTSVTVLEGDPAEEILRRARTVVTDLIVMGTHGRRGFDRWVQGSVAGRVVHKAPCAVLTVPRPPQGTPPGAAPAYGRILCAADLRGSEAVIDAALSVARVTDARVTVLHVVEGLSHHEATARTELAQWPDFVELVTQDARQRLRQAVESRSSGVEVDRLVLCGKAYRDILDVAGARNVGLIVMGVHAKNPLERMFVGSTSLHVLRLAACPVLTVHAPEGARA